MRSDALAPQTNRAGISLQPLEHLADLEALRHEWRMLWRRCPAATPFQSPDWLIPWWRHYGEGRLLSWAMRRAGRLIGIAPLYVYPEGASRLLFLIGTGNTDYLDILCEPEQVGPMARVLLRQLALRRALWDVCDFQPLAPDAALLHAPLPAGWRDEVAPLDVCPILTLPTPTSGDQAAQIWRKAQYYRRRAKKLGEVALECANGDSFEEIFAALMELHGRRWREQGPPGAAAARRDRDFHRAAARALLRQSMLRLYALRMDKRIIAALYGIRAHRRSYFYLSGFDPDFAALSPGTQIVAHAVEQAMHEGAETFDFLRGGEAYKYRWGATDRPNSLRRMRFGRDDGELDGARQISGLA